MALVSRSKKKKREVGEVLRGTIFIGDMEKSRGDGKVKKERIGGESKGLDSFRG